MTLNVLIIWGLHSYNGGKAWSLSTVEASIRGSNNRRLLVNGHFSAVAPPPWSKLPVCRGFRIFVRHTFPRRHGPCLPKPKLSCKR